jgi:hypothetical protein
LLGRNDDKCGPNCSNSLLESCLNFVELGWIESPDFLIGFPYEWFVDEIVYVRNADALAGNPALMHHLCERGHVALRHTELVGHVKDSTSSHTAHTSLEATQNMRRLQESCRCHAPAVDSTYG